MILLSPTSVKPYSQAINNIESVDFIFMLILCICAPRASVFVVFFNVLL